MKGNNMRTQRSIPKKLTIWAVLPALLAGTWLVAENSNRNGRGNLPVPTNALPNLIHKDPIVQNGVQMIVQGRQFFRFDTFGDEAFWGDTLLLHLAIEGAKFGGVGPGVSPGTALALGLK